jgi:predicted outer membrane repeat protein
MSAYTEISRSVFKGNSAVEGGGIGCTGAIVCISNSLFYGNTAYITSCGNRGGGIGIWNSSSASITNCTVHGNQSSYNGGGVYCENSSLAVWNSIIRSNSCGAYTKQVFGSNSTVSVQFSDVELGFDELPWGPNCIDADPAFISPAGGDFRLSIGSPCIDKGSNEAPCNLDTDLAGRSRIFGDVVDMGAYELSY